MNITSENVSILFLLSPLGVKVKDTCGDRFPGDNIFGRMQAVEEEEKRK